MFDDRLVFETPGKLPGIVRIANIHHTHFSRNPKIAEYLKAYDYVKEFGKGVDRMCRELASVGTKEPHYQLVAFIMKTTVYASILTDAETTQAGQEKGQGKNVDLIISVIKANPTMSISALSEECQISVKATRVIIDKLKKWYAKTCRPG